MSEDLGNLKSGLDLTIEENRYLQEGHARYLTTLPYVKVGGYKRKLPLIFFVDQDTVENLKYQLSRLNRTTEAAHMSQSVPHGRPTFDRPVGLVMFSTDVLYDVLSLGLNFLLLDSLPLCFSRSMKILHKPCQLGHVIELYLWDLYQDIQIISSTILPFNNFQKFSLVIAH